jgi:hypothetical protein
METKPFTGVNFAYDIQVFRFYLCKTRISKYSDLLENQFLSSAKKT